MKRDFDLIRKILIALESNEHGQFGATPAIDGYTPEQVGYHIHLMGQAGLLFATSTTNLSSKSPSAIPNSITWDGHNFLDDIKDDTVWAKAKTTILKPVAGAAAGVGFDILLAWVKEEARQRLGLP